MEYDTFHGGIFELDRPDPHSKKFFFQKYFSIKMYGFTDLLRSASYLHYPY